MNCPQCGTPIPEGAQTCPACGRVLTAPDTSSTYQKTYADALPGQTAQKSLHVDQANTINQQTQDDYIPAGFVKQTHTDNTTSPQQSPQSQPQTQQTAAYQPSPISQAFQGIIKGSTWATLLLAIAVGFACAIVATGIVIGIAALSALIGSGNSIRDLLQNATSALDSMSDAQGMGNTSVSPFASFTTLLLLGMGASGTLSGAYDMIFLGSMTLNASLSGGVLGLSGIAFFIGVAFTIFALEHGHTIMRGEGIVNAVALGFITGIIAVIFAVTGRIHVNDNGMDMTLSLTSGRTFVDSCLLAALAALAAYYLARVQPARSTVFSAFSAWKKRARGPVRTLTEYTQITLVTFATLTLIVLLAMPFLGRGDDTRSATLWLGQTMGFLAFGTATVMVDSLATMGSINYAAEVNVSFLGQSTGINGNVSILSLTGGRSGLPIPAKISWVPWLLLVLMILLIIYTGFREAARNQYDKTHAVWSECWQAPLGALILALIFTLMFPGVSISALGGIVSARLRMSLVFALLAAADVFIVEIIARTFGWPVVKAMPALWRLFLPGTVTVDAPTATAGTVQNA